MTIISGATIWSVTYNHNWRHQLRLELARIINYYHNCSSIVLATVITIINYNRKTFILQATEHVIAGSNPMADYHWEKMARKKENLCSRLDSSVSILSTLMGDDLKYLVKLKQWLSPSFWNKFVHLTLKPGNTTGGSIAVLLTSCLTGLD